MSPALAAHEECGLLMTATHRPLRAQVGLTELFGWTSMPSDDDPLALLYLEPGAIEPAMHAAMWHPDDAEGDEVEADADADAAFDI